MTIPYRRAGGRTGLGLLPLLAFFLFAAACRPAPPEEPAVEESSAPEPAEDICTGASPCPQECYRGPSRCGGDGACTRDIVCRPPGYDPKAAEPPSGIDMIRSPGAEEP